MAAGFDIVTMDTPDTVALSEFWCAALGLVELEREDGTRWIAIGTPEGTRVLGFQIGEHRVGGTHVDLDCGADEFDAELERLVGLGATTEGPPRTEHYGRIANLTDPDGNPFDLCAYGVTPG